MPVPGPGGLFRVWLWIGFQSFGGGAATLALIRRAAVEEHAWVSDAEFARLWALSQIAPGINLFSLTILLGRRLGGIGGIVVSLAGLMLPSVSITLLLTAVYASLRGLAFTQSALRGVVPATIGVGVLTPILIARPLLHAAHAEGRTPLCFSVALLLGSGLCAAAGTAAIVVVLLGAGALGAVFQVYRASTAPRRHP